jgi:hypothetical protein
MVAPAFAERPLEVKIPFDFTVGAKRMSAGEYTVKYDVPGSLWVVRRDGKAACVVLTMAVQGKVTPEVGKLVFNRYGDSYFLAQIWSPGYDQGRQLPKSKAELEIARNVGAVQHASVPAGRRQPAQ